MNLKKKRSKNSYIHLRKSDNSSFSNTTNNPILNANDKDDNEDFPTGSRILLEKSKTNYLHDLAMERDLALNCISEKTIFQVKTFTLITKYIVETITAAQTIQTWRTS
ncbi:hypothetical protein M8J76_004203 [Diaphorina citri]|nr:hypothetical protein M8J76_004203 [Diaphorina citri]